MAPFEPPNRSQDAGLAQQLAAARDRLSPKMMRVALFVEAHLADAGFMSTRELARAAGVSLATVVRFPRLLGYADFDAFRLAIRDHVNAQLSGVERLKRLPHDDATVANLMQRIVDEDIHNLRRLVRSMADQPITAFVDALQGADRTLVLALRYVAPLGSYFAYSLNKIKPGVEAHGLADSTLYDRIRAMGRRDLIVAIGFARYPRDLIDLLRYARALERPVIAITDSAMSPLVGLADTCVYAAGTIRDFVGSLAAPGALINCLVSELAQRTEPAALERLAAAEQAAASGKVYVGMNGAPRQWLRPLIAGPEANRCGDRPPERSR